MSEAADNTTPISLPSSSWALIMAEALRIPTGPNAGQDNHPKPTIQARLEHERLSQAFARTAIDSQRVARGLQASMPQHHTQRKRAPSRRTEGQNGFWGVYNEAGAAPC